MTSTRWGPLGGAHEHRFVAHEQILALDQFDAHLLGQEGVLEIGAVMGAGGHQHDRGVGDAGGSDAAEVVEQHVGVVVDRRDAVGREQLGEQPHHHFAVFQHIGDAGGDAEVVLQDEKLAGVVADDVDPGDVGVDAAGDVDALHLRAVLGITEDLLRGDHARLENLLVVVNVVEEGVQGPDPLLEAGLEAEPFLVGEHPGDDVERDKALGALFLAVDGKRDADPVKQGVGLGPFLTQSFGGLVAQPLAIAAVVRAVRAVVQLHFVIRFFGQKVLFSG